MIDDDDDDECFGVEGIVGFQPKKKGNFAIEVTQDGKAIPGSPFKIEVGAGQLCQASKVHVTGASKEATANKWNDVNINIAEAGTEAGCQGRQILQKLFRTRQTSFDHLYSPRLVAKKKKKTASK